MFLIERTNTVSSGSTIRRVVVVRICCDVAHGSNLELCFATCVCATSERTTPRWACYASCCCCKDEWVKHDGAGMLRPRLKWISVWGHSLCITTRGANPCELVRGGIPCWCCNMHQSVPLRRNRQVENGKKQRATCWALGGGASGHIFNK